MVVEFVAPARAKRLWGWLAPSRNWGLMLLVSWRSWHIGAEVWSTGAAINIGPLSFGGGYVAEKITDAITGNSGKQ